LSFSMWWNGDSGWFRRPKGQGPHKHKKYDWMDFRDRPDIAREYPYLRKWILNRQRDQERGRKFFPIFPDILFYLKFFIVYPIIVYTIGSIWANRKSQLDYFRRSLTRDREIEESFFELWSLDGQLRDFVQSLDTSIGFFMSQSMGGKDASTMHKQELSPKEKNISDYVEGYDEYKTDRYRDRWLVDALGFGTGVRDVRRTDGKGASLLWLYGMLPLRFCSRVVGVLSNTHIPTFMRPAVYGTYASAFGVNMEEAAESDFRFYPSMNAFFRRAIKPETRPISKLAPLVSPADGRVLHFSKCESGFVEQVKGVDYSVRRFLGRIDTEAPLANESEANFCRNLCHNPQNDLYQIVIYLAPGDYHRFHAPCKFNIQSRRHFPGDLFSVNPKVASFVKDLFVLNERATLYGEWSHGFFSYSAVGATNVGSIVFHYDPQLVTNRQAGRPIHGSFVEKDFTKLDARLPYGLPVTKGEMLGEFNFGSTIVLIFEAPKNFVFKVTPGQKVKMGEAIGLLP